MARIVRQVLRNLWQCSKEATFGERIRYPTHSEWPSSAHDFHAMFLGFCAGFTAIHIFAEDDTTTSSAHSNKDSYEIGMSKNLASDTISALRMRIWPSIAEAHAEAATNVLYVPTTLNESESDGQMHASRDQTGSSECTPQGPWVLDEKMELVIHRRGVNKNRLVAYIHHMQRHMMSLSGQAQLMGERGEKWFQEELRKLEPEVDLQSQKIIFGVDEPNARKSYLERYGCTRWTEEALQVIKSFSPLIEIGGGHGHWQKALTSIGADVLAFDDGSALPVLGMDNVGEVQKGNEKEIRRHPRRTLLLVYPGPTDMGLNCLNEYRGRYLLYVGEPRGGINGNEQFFNELEREWTCERVVPLDPFPDGYEQLYILKRKQSGGSSWWRKIYWGHRK
ncbi:hypothetical protein CEUSTIGMA_g9532.t1 [Chlamydomonas eustigma]|uniref:Uncharacterized protein n=1 Tax=Chlamydomonas eustigma TaxID=1157962 RepID=A0A250XG93_9CHLO|nr:hypothetical protein CEUSTIGMA_g9532.t1 [Chlamydomonas eustigma]|eukprot:GAX82104.1 hypothetical protein CEUSTIGMA_g9532.t1 [Chlamydomonas eustigma]